MQHSASSVVARYSIPKQLLELFWNRLPLCPCDGTPHDVPPLDVAGYSIPKQCLPCRGPLLPAIVFGVMSCFVKNCKAAPPTWDVFGAAASEECYYFAGWHLTALLLGSSCTFYRTFRNNDMICCNMLSTQAGHAI